MVWEYFVIYLSVNTGRPHVEATLDICGLERWELVSVIYNGTTEQIQYFFKRESLERIR